MLGGYNHTEFRKGLKESIDPRGCKMKGLHGWVQAHRFRVKGEGVYRHKRLQDEGVAWVGTSTQI